MEVGKVGFFGGGWKGKFWYIRVFPKIGVPQNGWFTMENPIKMDDLGGPPLFLETSIRIHKVRAFFSFRIVEEERCFCWRVFT